MKEIPIRHLTQPDSGSFTIRAVEALLGGQDLVQELHRHEFFLVLCLERGRGEHSIDFTFYPVGDFSVFLMRPGQVHQLALQRGSTGFLLEFNADFYAPRHPHASPVVRRAFDHPGWTGRPEGFARLQAVLQGIVQEQAEKRPGYREVIKAYLDILFVEIGRQRPDPPPGPDAPLPYAREVTERLLLLIEAHVATTKQAARYAQLLHLSPYQLNAITRQTLGKTCAALITEQVILEAKRYLLATANQVTQIAWHLGYEDVSYFIRFFRKHTGYSPEAFRLRHR